MVETLLKGTHWLTLLADSTVMSKTDSGYCKRKSNDKTISKRINTTPPTEII